jgi:hypothetical protein
MGALNFFSRTKADMSRPWPRNNVVQPRTNGRCTALKLEAWGLVQYDGVALVDTDVCFHEDLFAWMRRLHRSRTYFAATREVAGRPHLGLNTHLVYLKPSSLLHQILRDKARLGDFMPYVNAEQDVIESVFPAHLEWAGTLPNHTHLVDHKDRGCHERPRASPKHDGVVVIRARSANSPRSFRRATTSRSSASTWMFRGRFRT